jgi:hypothetical protein
MVGILTYDRLFDYCTEGKKFNHLTKKLLDSHDGIDVLFDNGLFFFYAIKLHNIELFNMLMHYYEGHVLEPAKAKSSDEYNKALFMLAKELESLTRRIDIENPEIEEVVNKYINFITQDNEASSDTTSLGDEEASSFVESDNEDLGSPFNSKEDVTLDANYQPLTAENLEKFTKSLETSCKIDSNIDISGRVQE